MSDQQPTTSEAQTKAENNQPEQVVLGEDGKPLSKSQMKKLEKEKKKADTKAKNEEKQKAQGSSAEDPLKDNYGDVEFCQSSEITDRKWIPIEEISEDHDGKLILVRARVHNVRAPSSKLAFVILRERYATVQAVASVGDQVSTGMVKFLKNLPRETVVDVYAKVTVPKDEIVSCTLSKKELVINKIYAVSRSAPLVFQIEDASRKVEAGEDQMEDYDEPKKAAAEKDNKPAEKEVKPEPEQEEQKSHEAPKVLMKTRLDNRIIDLRTKSKQAIFRLSSGVCQLFREFLYQNKFVEIHSPKLIGGSSEGGANVFKLKYFKYDACLAQSPQLYKQMAVMGDFDRVFEIGPVFRAENSFTHRHMCEFTGLDMEMSFKEHYFELMDIMADLFCYIFDNLETRYGRELQVVNEQFPFEPFKCKRPVLRITFAECVELLKEKGVIVPPLEDFDTETEKKIGAIIKEKFNTDFYFIYRYPANARPFYTMPCKDDPNYTNSYDFFMRGEEITSGGQRVHDPDFLKKRIESFGIDPATLQSYIDSFKYGAPPHGGCGIGLERVVMLYCNLRNIRNSSMFPRDPKRLLP